MQADIPITHVEMTDGGHVFVSDYALIVMFINQFGAKAQIERIFFSVGKLQVSLDRRCGAERHGSETNGREDRAQSQLIHASSSLGARERRFSIAVGTGVAAHMTFAT